MPKISLVVCLYREGDLLQRMLDRAQDCYDDLVVVHDGPDDTGVREIAEAKDGRFFEQPRAYCGEPHWPFALGEAKHDWVLRLDADEFPSEDLVAWLQAFRNAEEPAGNLSGFTAIWPLWDGRRARTRYWPLRLFLINRQRVKVIGLCHSGPLPDGRVDALPLILHHQPPRKTYGVRNMLFRPISKRWLSDIANALLRPPTELPCWRWDDPNWPKKLEEIRRRPLWTGVKRLVLSPIWNGREMIRCGEFPNPAYLVTFPLHHWMACWAFHKARKAARKQS